MEGSFELNPSYCFVGSGKEALETYTPTLEEYRCLTHPLVDKLDQHTVYQVLGLSTQVMVLDVSSPLSVAFIGAHETRLTSGVVWDPLSRSYVGIISSTDHLKILLYCNSHPEETEAVAQWTIGYWLTLRNTLPLYDGWASSLNPSHHHSSSTPFLSCTISTTLKECLERMKSNAIQRLAVLSEKESPSFDLVAMIDVQQIVEYLGSRVFGHNDNANSPASAFKESHGVGLDPSLGTGSLPDDPANMLSPLSSTLPPLVSSILLAGSDKEGSGPRVGPYTSIFDIPFRCLPMIGGRKNRTIYVTMEDSLAKALRLMLEHNIECIAVCTPDKIVLDVISRSDMLRMETQGVYNTNQTVREGIGARTLRQIHVFQEGDLLRDIFRHFVQKRVKELFMVNAHTNQLVGQLNIVEFVSFLLFPLSLDTDATPHS